jgi:hypothetical protein
LNRLSDAQEIGGKKQLGYKWRAAIKQPALKKVYNLLVVW